MSTPVSLPVVPAQPNLKTYAISALDLFVLFDRANFKAKFGHQAPPFNPNFAVKTWFDTSPEPSQVGYTIIVTGPTAADVKTMNMSDNWAKSYNLPGAYDYPPYSPSDTTSATTEGQPVNPQLLSYYSDALTLSTILNGPNPPLPMAVEESPIEWNNEKRRIYFVDAPNGGNYCAETLLLQMWAKGIGSPGAWNLSNIANPVWVPASGVDQFAHGVVPAPVRPLLPNERLQAGPAGIGWEIVRIDLE